MSKRPRDETNEESNKRIETAEDDSPPVDAAPEAQSAQTHKRGRDDDDLDQPSARRAATAPDPAPADSTAASSQYGAFADRVMAKMGWNEGQVLGRTMPGLAAPIIPDARAGRAGLGAEELPVPDMPFEPRDATVDSSNFIFPLPRCAAVEALTLVRGGRLDQVDSTPVCSTDILNAIMTAKTDLDVLNDKRKFREARSRANPYEQIDRAMFQNRAAMKMAELDHYFPLTTIPLLPEESGVLYFVDICAGPGGFTEYTYFRKRWAARGWGMTLRNNEDFNLNKFNSESPSETFARLYGPSRNGDITIKGNLLELESAVNEGTDGRGAALMMADGGVCTDGDWNRQEIITKQLLLGQFVSALMNVRQRGNFVCKMFDIFTPFSLGLIYIMCGEFDEVKISKPVQSRPANSERYLVCLGKRARRPASVDCLLDLNEQLHVKSNSDIHEIIPMELMESSGFIAAVRAACETIATRQVTALQDLRKYYLNPLLEPPADQEEARKNALELWSVPRTASRDAFIFNRSAEEILEHFGVNTRPGRILYPDFTREDLTRYRQQENPDNIVVTELCNGKIGLLVGTRRNGTIWFYGDRRPIRVDMVLPRGSIIAAELIRPSTFVLLDALCLACVSFKDNAQFDTYTARHAALCQLVAGLPKSRDIVVMRDVWTVAENVSTRFSNATRVVDYTSTSGHKRTNYGVLLIQNRAPFLITASIGGAIVTRSSTGVSPAPAATVVDTADTPLVKQWVRPLDRVSFFLVRYVSRDSVSLRDADKRAPEGEISSHNMDYAVRAVDRADEVLAYSYDGRKWVYERNVDASTEAPSSTAEVGAHLAAVKLNISSNEVLDGVVSVVASDQQ